jgi:uncharacterized protein (DUF433 family)
MTTSLTTQIEVDARGIAWIAGTQVKVSEVVPDKIACGSSPEEIHFQHPNVSLAQIHGALTYYYETQDKVDERSGADCRRPIDYPHRHQIPSSAVDWLI